MQNKTYMIIVMLMLSMLISTVGLAASPKNYSFNFMDEEIRVILHTLAKIGDVDMVIDDSVKGNMTIKLNNVTFDKALDLITAGKGLSYRKVGNSIIIEPADMGMTEVIKLRYTRATDIKKTIEPIASNLKLKIEIDDISNSIILTGSPTGCDRIKKILTSIDVLQQQVTLEAKVVAINKTNMKDLGMDWSWDATPQYSEFTPEKLTVSNGVTIVEPATVTRNNNKGVIQFGRNPEGRPYEFYYQAKISALISNGNAKILASPKVTTINGKEARVLIGDRIPVLTENVSNGTTSTTVQYVDAGIKLTYTPIINSDGTITAKVHTEVSTPTLVADIKNYRITTREAESNVSMRNGETMVIAGLIGSEETKNSSKVPFLSDLPLLGALFKSNHNSKSETEVVIFLTATIVK